MFGKANLKLRCLFVILQLVLLDVAGLLLREKSSSQLQAYQQQAYFSMQTQTLMQPLLRGPPTIRPIPLSVRANAETRLLP